MFSKFGLLPQHTSYNNIVYPDDDLHSPNLTGWQCRDVIRSSLMFINTIVFFVLRSIIDLKDVSFGIKSKAL